MKIATYLATFMACILLYGCAPKSFATYEIIPLPQEIEYPALTEAPFSLSSTTKVVYPEGDSALWRNAQFLIQYLNENTGKQLVATATPQESNAIVLVTDSTLSDNPDAYTITVNSKSINITGASAAGNFYGIQTLRKATPITHRSIEFPAVKITDYPRFAYRGAHLDVCRHFFSVDSVKRFIDILALHNINTFHWHLTDDQGWRIEIKKYPLLTEVGSMRDSTSIGHSNEYDHTPYGGYYTQDEAREIIKYAAEQYINVIPEIDLPGHMMAALASYPNLGCTGGPYHVWCTWGVNNNALCPGNDEVFTFLEGVLNEIIDIFPSRIIHIGGDECTRHEWKQCPKCQARIKSLGIKADASHSAEDYLQCYVTDRVEKMVNARGRTIMGWDEIIDGDIKPSAIIHSWRGKGESGWTAARRGHNVVMSPNFYMYFDFYQTADTETEPAAIGGCTDVKRVYSYEPIPDDCGLTPEEQTRILGVQANIWTEYIPNFKHAEYMALPRMAALAEVQWCSKENRSYDAFQQRLPQLIATYDNLGYNYARHIYNVEVKFENMPDDNATQVTLSTLGNANIYYTLNGTEPTTKDNLYTAPFLINSNCDLRARAIRNGINSATAKDSLRVHKSSFKKITLLQPVDAEFSFNGAPTLVDAMIGGKSYATGRWIGFHGYDAEAIIDFGNDTELSQASVRINVRQPFGVFDARATRVYKSDNGTDFTLVGEETYPAATEQPDDIVTHTFRFAPTTARYFKVVVESEHNIPAWHGAAGKAAYLFLDELALD